jgi:hypothetical protein
LDGLGARRPWRRQQQLDGRRRGLLQVRCTHALAIVAPGFPAAIHSLQQLH